MKHNQGGKFRRALAAGTAAMAFTITGASPVYAGAPPGQSVAVQVEIAGGNLGKALGQLGREAGVQIAFLPDHVRGRKAKSLRGTFTVEQALDRLLAGSGLRYKKTPGGSYVVGGTIQEATRETREKVDDIVAASGRDADGKAAIPDILVEGRTDWTLNLDIPRTANDAQPYVVFSHDQIARSGASSVEDFFKNFLNANATASNSTQNQAGATGQSVVNLRGLGSVNTLILVDGRRYAEANLGQGMFIQSSVNGIPLDAIERIEVLPSSASGIYGSNAVGGVVNIIMRRNYHGLEASLYYGNATRLDAFENRASLNGSFPLEQGRTRLSFSASLHKTGPLYEGDRNYIARGRALLLENSPNYFAMLTTPVLGATPNVVSDDATPLVLKPQYGGTALGSRITYVPAGYRGVALDGVAALVANAGKVNLDLSPTIGTGSGGDGMFATLLTPTKSYNTSLTLKREFNKWLSLYVEGDWSRYAATVLINAESGTYTLPASSPDNPFTKAIQVSVPIARGNQPESTTSTNWRLLTGAIVKLPLNWQAAIDLSWNWNIIPTLRYPPNFDEATFDAAKAGTLGVLRDISLYPPSFSYANFSAAGSLHPAISTSLSYTLKLAGPLPLLRLPGGKPILTLQLEQDKQTQGDAASFSNAPSSRATSTITYTPARSQRTDSAYGEVRFPILGERNHIPLVREFELQLAGRYDRYVGIGANTKLTCFQSVGPLPDSAFTAPCPQAGGTAAIFARTSNHSANPTIAAKWTISRDIAFRGSYSTGYVPPYLSSVVPLSPALGSVLAGKILTNVADPLRGNELVGQPFSIFRAVPGLAGGNPDVMPQTSKSWSFGTILTPRFVPGLRVSVDWSLINQDNLYFSPLPLIQGFFAPAQASQQQAFNDFLAAHPERFMRDTNPATFGAYSVGPIIFADVSTTNLSHLRSEAMDFTANYDRPISKGQLSLQASATRMINLTTQATISSLPINYTGVSDNLFLATIGAQGGVKWKGSGSVVYSTDRWSFGARLRYVGPYWLAVDHSVQPLQGAAAMQAQAYVDIFGSFNLTSKTTLRGGVNDVFDTPPPFSVASSVFYSSYGDPRRASFYVSVNRRF